MKKVLFKIDPDAKGIFRSRENRFLGEVEILSDSSIEKVHIRDPGRLEEILYPGNEVLLERADSKDRKTDWTVLAGKVNGDWIFINSGYHRELSERILKDQKISPFGGLNNYQAEVMLKSSRIDFRLKKHNKIIWLEVKGCTLSKDGTALFPDAPTQRGKRHVKELAAELDKPDTSGAIMFLIFTPDANCFKPHAEKDLEFTSALRYAVKGGLEIHPVKLEYDGEIIYYRTEIPLCEDF